MSAKKTDNSKSNSENEELVKRHDIEETPFTIVEAAGGYWGTMGKYRITEKLESKKAVEDAIMPQTWNNLVRIMVLVTESINQKSK